MAFSSEFRPLPLDQLHREAAICKAEGWRFMQTHAVNTESGVDLYYSFMKNGEVVNYRVEGVTPDQPVPSITDLFMAAFVFENEARELFGVDMRDIAIDFAGAMYAPAEAAPMTFISPEQKAAIEKARKAAAAKAAKEAGEGAGKAAADAPAPKKAGGFVMTPERRARLDAKLATMSPEKVAKVEAALKAREAEAAAGAQAPAATGEPLPEPAGTSPSSPAADSQQSAPDKAAKADAAPTAAKDDVLEEKLAQMDPEKAAKVRAALAARGAVEAGGAPTSEKAAEPAQATAPLDADLEAKLALMDEAKAAKVRAALAAKGVN